MVKALRTILSFIRYYLDTLLLFLYLGTIGFIFQKNRVLLHQLRNKFVFFKAPPIVLRLPIITLAEATQKEQTVLMSEPAIIQGNVSLYELLALNMFVKTFDPATIFEIGTFDGRTTLNFARNCSPNTKIYALDLPKDETSTALLTVARSDQNLINTNITGARLLRSTDTMSRKKITQLYGDSAKFDFTPYLNSIDFIFIDGAHTYEYVKNDTAIALKLLRNGKGVILWHDYDPLHEGSVRAIEELQAAHPSWDVRHVEGTNVVCLVLK